MSTEALPQPSSRTLEIIEAQLWDKDDLLTKQLRHIQALEFQVATCLEALEEAKLWVTDEQARKRMVAVCDRVRPATVKT